MKAKQIMLTSLAFMLLTILFSLFPPRANCPTHSPDIFQNGSADIVTAIDMQRVADHVKNLSSFGSRVTGYEGSRAAAQYIADAFRSYNLSVENQTYPVLVPIDHGSSITVLSPTLLNLTAYALWPNYVQTCSIPPEGIEGELIYVGMGTLPEFNNKSVEGSIVLMDFNSYDNWLNAAKLGAKAVVFIEPAETVSFEARSKFLVTPLRLPRLYVAENDGKQLKDIYVNATASKGSVRVRLNSVMRYETVEAQNIIGIAQGELSNEVIVVAAHYDTWSVVPKLAPGADEATSIAVMLEMARFFAENRSLRTIWFVALSGHWEALAGAREFVEKYYFDEKVISGELKIWMFIGLDFSTDNEAVALLCTGGFYGYGAGTTTAPNVAISNRFRLWIWPLRDDYGITKYLKALNETFGKSYENFVENGFTDVGWWVSIPTSFMIDSEPFAVSQGIGFTIRTTNCYRLNWGLPLNTFDKVNFENLRTQVDISSIIVAGFANEEKLATTIQWNYITPVRVLYVGGGAAGRPTTAGFVTLNGKVAIYNLSKGTYDPFPNAIVCVKRNVVPPSVQPFGAIFTRADENGSFTVHGLAPGICLEASTGYYVEAYFIDPETGLIVYAPDQGVYGSRTVPFTTLTRTHPSQILTVIFKCSSAAIFDLINPSTMRPLVISRPTHAVYTWAWTSVQHSVLPYDFETLTQPLTYSVVSTGREPLAMVFLPPRTRFAIFYRVGALLDMTGIAINASVSRPEGNGFLLSEEEELHLSFTTFQFVKDFILVTEGRYNKLKESYIRNAVVEKALEMSNEHYVKAQEALDRHQYDEAYSEVMSAWPWAIRAYSNTLNTIKDTSTTTAIFFALLLPFAFLFESLLFKSSGLKRLILTIAIFVVASAIIYFIHPSFKLASNMGIGMLGLVLETFFLFILLVFVDEVTSILKLTREKLVGLHFLERSRTSVALMAFPVAIENMRRRKLRTTLTMLTLVIMVFSLTSLTSASLQPEAMTSVPQPSRGKLLYNGLLVKQGHGEPWNFLGDEVLTYVRGLVGTNGVVSPRAVYYSVPLAYLGEGGGVRISATGPNGSWTAFALMGITPKESEVWDLNEMIMDEGWSFLEGQYYVCMISEEASNKMGASIGDEISCLGLKLRVTGIFDGRSFDGQYDLDQTQMTPLDPNLVQGISLIIRGTLGDVYEPLPSDSVIVVPYELARDLGGDIYSIAVRVDDPKVIEETARRMVFTVNLGLYAGYDEQVTFRQKKTVLSLYGWAFMSLPLIIVALNVLVILLGGVKERENEIKIYSSIGLSPTGTTIIFFIEAAVYAIVAALIGYLTGIAFNVLFISQGFLPQEFTVNYASSFIASAIGVTMLTALLSSLYPTLKASKLVTPSLERKWKITTKPREERWVIPLPFSITGKNEAFGVLAYMEEYFTAHTEETEEVFIVEDVKVLYDELAIQTVVLLAPFEANVTQEAIIKFSWSEEAERFGCNILLRHLTGLMSVWVTSNYRFVDAVRKQLLTWRMLRENQRLTYMDRAEQMLRNLPRHHDEPTAGTEKLP